MEERDYYQGKVTRATAEQEEWVRSHRRQNEDAPGTAGDVTEDAVGWATPAPAGASPTEDAGGVVQTGAVSAPSAWIGESR